MNPTIVCPTPVAPSTVPPVRGRRPRLPMKQFLITRARALSLSFFSHFLIVNKTSLSLSLSLFLLLSTPTPRHVLRDTVCVCSLLFRHRCNGANQLTVYRYFGTSYAAAYYIVPRTGPSYLACWVRTFE